MPGTFLFFNLLDLRDSDLLFVGETLTLKRKRKNKNLYFGYEELSFLWLKDT